MQRSISYPVIELGLGSSLKLSSIELRWESALPSTEEGLQNMTSQANDGGCNATGFFCFFKDILVINENESPS